VSKKSRQLPLFFVVAWKNGKWVVLNEQPVLRTEAVRLIAAAWKSNCMARLRPAASAKAA
jgi:hypothetical protein